jgi:hypothetical protein
MEEEAGNDFLGEVRLLPFKTPLMSHNPMYKFISNYQFLLYFLNILILIQFQIISSVSY